MSFIINVRLRPWESVKAFVSEEEVAKGDMVEVEDEFGTEDGEVVFVKSESKISQSSMPKVLKKLSFGEIQKAKEYKAREGEIISRCRDLIKQHNLPMKLVGAKFMYDGSKVTIAFTSESRVDFRQLVKDLTREFQKSVRLQQIGSRDEAREVGGLGHCGHAVCCKTFMKDMKSITTDMAVDQDIAHRGSERLSGLCGRLMCCLAFEENAYKEVAKNFPSKWDVVIDKKNKIEGVVVDRNVLRGEVLVQDAEKNKHKCEIANIKIKTKFQGKRPANKKK